MLEIRRYKIGFDAWGLVLFLTIMLPNFIWFAIPAPDDILRNTSVTSSLDTVASVFQAAMVIAICIIINTQCQKPMKRIMFAGILFSITLYFAGWFLYYKEVINAFVILDLCIAPCIAVILFSLARKNAVAFISAIIFMICHTIYGIVNFIV